jgi:hypothetical protein
MVSEKYKGANLSLEVDLSRIWKARDGSIPLLDNPTLVYSAYKWDKPPIININLTTQRMKMGQIGQPDVSLSKLLIDWQCVTENQIRRLATPFFEKGHHAASRLRLLLKIGWFDGFSMSSTEGKKEHVWVNGISSHQYYTFVEGYENIQDPIQLLQATDYTLSICAINEFRLLLEERGNPVEVDYAPVGRKEDPTRPLAQFVVETNKGPLTIYMERLVQKGKPLSNLRKKIYMYEKMIELNGGKLPTTKKGAAMVVWSVGTIQAIEEIVGSADYFPETFFHVFLVDECLPAFPDAFIMAKKGQRVGEVNLSPVNMDLF